MELKLQNILGVDMKKVSSNRTYMELKRKQSANHVF